jgi:hypothetical protein
MAMLICLIADLMVLACPFCDSETGKQVRTSIFGSDFFADVISISLPFGVLLTAVTAVSGRRRKPFRRGRHND